MKGVMNMPPVPKALSYEREFTQPYFPKHWIIWDPIPDHAGQLEFTPE
jgi:hypothetical protein